MVSRRLVPPKMSVIAAWWVEWNRGRGGSPLLGECWSESPFCFRCRWRAPWDDRIDDSTYEVAILQRKNWDWCGGWLEKAHLVAHHAGGSNDPSNFVPLCAPCHEEMGSLAESRESALSWVWAGERAPLMWQIATNALGGPAPTRRGLLDLRMIYVRAMMEVVR